MKKAAALILLGLSAAACTVSVPPPGGGGGGIVITPPGGGGGGGGGGTQYNQTIGITTANGSRESITQSFSPNVAEANVTRICVVNHTKGERILRHNFTPPINPIRLGGGGSDCANFPANSRVGFRLFAAGRSAIPDKAMTYSTTALAGGRLDLVWQ